MFSEAKPKGADADLRIITTIYEFCKTNDFNDKANANFLYWLRTCNIGQLADKLYTECYDIDQLKYMINKTAIFQQTRKTVYLIVAAKCHTDRLDIIDQERMSTMYRETEIYFHWHKIKPTFINICIGLQSLEISANEILAILEESYQFNHYIPLHFKWDLVCLVKHWNEIDKFQKTKKIKVSEPVLKVVQKENVIAKIRRILKIEKQN